VEGMGNDVLTKEEQMFLNTNTEEIKQFAGSLFAGSIDMDRRDMYQRLYFKAGGKQEICYTCGGSLKHLGMKLEATWL
jgi:hypothetical protein